MERFFSSYFLPFLLLLLLLFFSYIIIFPLSPIHFLLVIIVLKLKISCLLPWRRRAGVLLPGVDFFRSCRVCQLIAAGKLIHDRDPLSGGAPEFRNPWCVEGGRGGGGAGVTDVTHFVAVLVDAALVTKVDGR